MVYKWNNKSWMIAHLLQYGLLDILSPLLKSTAQKKKKNSFQILLFIDNAPGHSRTLIRDIEGDYVVFSPAEKTSILKPMDQGVILTFKSYDLRNIFCKAIATKDSYSSDGFAAAAVMSVMSDSV